MRWAGIFLVACGGAVAPQDETRDSSNDAGLSSTLDASADADVAVSCNDQPDGISTLVTGPPPRAAHSFFDDGNFTAARPSTR